jgi:site-specific DNA-cytosine methylase
MELCGGLGIFLEACLRRKLHISKFTYADTSPDAHAVMRRRLSRLQRDYPDQLPASALFGWDIDLAHDVLHISPQHLDDLPPVNLLAAGPPCQGFSYAGHQRGWLDGRSHLVPAAIRIAHARQQRNPKCLYILENVSSRSLHRQRQHLSRPSRMTLLASTTPLQPHHHLK